MSVNDQDHLHHIHHLEYCSHHQVQHTPIHGLLVQLVLHDDEQQEDVGETAQDDQNQIEEKYGNKNT